jgi:type I restriction enzyme M protein
VVGLDEIRQNEHNLNLSRYVDTLEPEPPVDVPAALRRLREAEQTRDAAAAEMDRILKELGYGP